MDAEHFREQLRLRSDPVGFPRGLDLVMDGEGRAAQPASDLLLGQTFC